MGGDSPPGTTLSLLLSTFYGDLWIVSGVQWSRPVQIRHIGHLVYFYTLR